MFLGKIFIPVLQRSLSHNSRMAEETLYRIGQRLAHGETCCVKLHELHCGFACDENCAVPLSSALVLLARVDRAHARTLYYGIARFLAGGDRVLGWIIGNCVLFSDLLDELHISDKTKATRTMISTLATECDPFHRVDSPSSGRTRRNLWISVDSAVRYAIRTHTPNRDARDRLICTLKWHLGKIRG